MKITKLLSQLFLASLLITSCSSDDELVNELPDAYNKGIIVSSEGAFGNKDGSIAYVDSSLSNLATNFIYTGKNNAQLGGLIQSITFSDTNAYIILNDVNSIVVVDKETFKKKSEITTGLKNPRYMTIVNGKGYVTNWGEGANTTDDYLAVIDITTNQIESTTISLANGVEQIVNRNNKLYVSHKGAWSSNNIISVIDLNNSNSVSTITVKDNPDEMTFDNSGNLIVLSEGKPLTYNNDYTEVLTSTESSISFIDTAKDEVAREIVFPENKRATYLAYADNKIYYYQGDTDTIYNINSDATALGTDGVNVGSIYGMNVKQNQIFTVANAFDKLSKLKVFDANTKSEVYTSPVGLGASKIYFNN